MDCEANEEHGKGFLRELEKSTGWGKEPKMRRKRRGLSENQSPGKLLPGNSNLQKESGCCQISKIKLPDTFFSFLCGQLIEKILRTHNFDENSGFCGRLTGIGS